MSKANLVALFGAASVVALSSTAQARDLFVFGDSLSDNGNIAQLQYIDPAYYPGRYSTGPVWVEDLGFNLGRAGGLTQLQPATGNSYNGGYDFAHASATANLAGFNLPGGPNTFGTQASFFKSKVASKAIKLDSDDVAIVYFGTNDYLTYANSTPAQGVAAIKTQSKVVLDAGVKNMLILGLPDWGRAPVGSLWGNNPVTISATVNLHNSLLSTNVTDLRRQTGKNVGFVDVDGLLADMQARGSLYGLTITKMGYQKNGQWSDGSCIDDGYNWTNCPSGYLFADGLHWSGRGNKILANFVQAKTYGLFAGQTNAQTANQSVALIETMLTTAVQDLFSRIFGNGSLNYGLAESAGPARGYTVMLTDESAAQPAWMHDSQDRYTLVGRAAPINEHLTIGFSSLIGKGYGETGIDTADTHSAAGFAAWRDGDWTLSLNASSRVHGNAVIRATGFDEYPEVAAHFSSRSDTATMTAARTFELEGWHVTPAAELVTTRDRADGYTETGAPAFLAETLDAHTETGAAAGFRLDAGRTWSDHEGGGYAVAFSGTMRKAVSGAPRTLIDAPLPELADELVGAQGDAQWARAEMRRTFGSGVTLGLSAVSAETATGESAASVQARAGLRW